MKSAVGLGLFLLMGCATAQVNVIDQFMDKQSGKEIVLLNVSNDSRCPEGVQCVWAGEVTVEVVAYEDGKKTAQQKFRINRDTQGELVDWFTAHLPARKEKIKTVAVLPYPKEGVVIKPEDYKIVLN